MVWFAWVPYTQKKTFVRWLLRAKEEKTSHATHE